MASVEPTFDGEFYRLKIIGMNSFIPEDWGDTQTPVGESDAHEFANMTVLQTFVTGNNSTLSLAKQRGAA